MIKLAIPFQLNGELNDEIKEFNILFYKSRNSIEDLIDFVQEYDNTRINLEFPEGIHMPTVKSINKVSDKIYIRVAPTDITKAAELKENSYKFFFNQDMKVPTYSCLESFINLGVSDVYIADDLCYNLKNVHDICQENNVQMRLILNQVPSMTLDRGINPKAPIFMPKDMDTINPYFDVFEFECGLPYDWAKFDVLYRAWFINKYWHGQMSEINEDVDMDFHCDAIHPSFTASKINCERRCCKRLSNHCNKCEDFLSLGEVLKKKQIRFTN